MQYTYSEFVKELERISQKYRVQFSSRIDSGNSEEDYVVITLDEDDKNYKIARISVAKTLALNTQYDSFERLPETTRRELFNLFSDFAKMRIDDRKIISLFALKKLKTRFYDVDGLYLNWDKEKNIFPLREEIQKFTEKEIEQIKRINKTDLEEFERIKVD